MRQPFRDADHRAGPATPWRVLAERNVRFALEDVDDLRLLDMVVPARLAARRNLPEDQLEAGTELASDQAPIDGPGMRWRRVCGKLRYVLDQLTAQPGIRHLRPPMPRRKPPLRSAAVVHTTYLVMGMTSQRSPHNAPTDL